MMVQKYNAGMGGVDLLDNLVACYRYSNNLFFFCTCAFYSRKKIIYIGLTFILSRVPYRIKKWWFPIYTWSLSVSAVNAWRLRMRVTGEREPYLDFLRELCISMLTEHGTAPTRKRLSNGPDTEARFDGKEHWVVNTEEDAAGKFKRRNCKHCALSGKHDMKTVYLCEKCKVPLHIFCFKERIRSFLIKFFLFYILLYLHLLVNSWHQVF